MSDESTKVEFSANNGIIEIRYFDTPKDKLYRSWRLSESIVNELIAWWTTLKKDKQMSFPLRKRAKVCEFTMHTERYIEIKSLDSLGRTNMTGWSLPNIVVEELISRSAKQK